MTTTTNLTRNWWLMLLRGIVAVLFGLAAFSWPGLTFVVLVLVFGLYALVDGIFAVVTGLTRIGDSPRWWIFLVEGLVSIAAGLLTFIWPGVTGLAILYLIAGVLMIILSMKLRVWRTPDERGAYQPLMR